MALPVQCKYRNAVLIADRSSEHDAIEISGSISDISLSVTKISNTFTISVALSKILPSLRYLGVITKSLSLYSILIMVYYACRLKQAFFYEFSIDRCNTRYDK